MKKRLLSLLLSMMLTFSATAVSYADIQADNETQNSEYIEKIMFIKGLGILGTASSLVDNETISRADLAELLYNMINCGDSSSKDVRHYIDVSYTDSRYKEIESISGKGLMCGTPDKMFNPDNLVTYNQAIKTMVCALNYQVIAENNGGFPVGYLNVATSKKLTKGLSGYSGDDNITGNDLAILIYNTVHTEIMEAEAIIGDRMTVSESETNILKKYHDIIYIEGVEDCNCETSIYERNECSEGKVRINEKEYSYDNEEDYLGYNIRAYVKDTDNDNDYDTIVFMKPLEEKNISFRLESDDIVSYSSLEYQYETEKNVKRAELSNDVKIIYNGKLLKPHIDSLMIPEYGYIEMISNDKDNDYDVVFIHDWDIIAVGDVSTVNGIASDIYYKNIRLEIDFDNDDIDFFVYDGKDTISFEQIKKNDVLSVEKSYDGRLIKIFRSTECVEGTLSSIGSKTLNIDGNEYEVVPGRIGCQDFVAGKSGKYLLDNNGRVAGFVASQASTWMYGIVTRCYTSTDGMLDRLYIRMFTATGKEETFGTTDKFKLDGERLKNDDENNTAFAIDRMTENDVDVIRFKKNADDMITEIDTLTYNAGKEDRKSLFRILDKKNYWYNGSAYTFAGKMIISGATVIKVDPSPIGNIKEDYQVVGINTIKGNQAYSAECFGLGNDTLIPELVIMHVSVGKGAVIDDTQTWMVVDSCERTINEDDEVVDVISGMWKNYVHKVSFEEDVLSTTIRRGDIIRFSQNDKGLISTYEKVYDSMTGKLGYGGNVYPGGAGGGEDYFAGVGYVLRNENGQMVVTYDKKNVGDALPEDYQIWNISSAPIYICEYIKSGKVNIKIGSQSDIIGYDTSNNEYSKVIINGHWYQPTEVFVIKELD